MIYFNVDKNAKQHRCPSLHSMAKNMGHGSKSESEKAEVIVIITLEKCVFQGIMLLPLLVFSVFVGLFGSLAV